MKLDVDCWNNPTGNVNVDLLMNEETLHIDARSLYPSTNSVLLFERLFRIR